MLLKYHDYERDLLLDLLADLDLDLPLDFERDASLSALDPALSADLDLSRDLDFERSLDFDLCSDLNRDLDVERRLDLDLSLDLRSDRDRSLFLLGLLVLDRDLLLLLLLDLLLEYDLLLLPLDLLRLLLLAPGSGLAYFAILRSSVQRIHCILCITSIQESNKCKSATFFAILVTRNVNVSNLSILFKQIFKILVIGTICQIIHLQRHHILHISGDASTKPRHVSLVLVLNRDQLRETGIVYNQCHN